MDCAGYRFSEAARSMSGGAWPTLEAAGIERAYLTVMVIFFDTTGGLCGVWF